MRGDFSALAAEIESLLKHGLGLTDPGDEDDVTARRGKAVLAGNAMVINKAQDAERVGEAAPERRKSGGSPKLLRSGIGAAGKTRSGAAAAGSMTSSAGQLSVNSLLGTGAGAASGIFGVSLAIYSAWEDDLHKRGGGGGKRQRSSTKSKRNRRGEIHDSSEQSENDKASVAAKAAAARAAVAGGAQAAVFKVISTPGSKGSAGTLMDYLGRREAEDGKKLDIDVETEDGRILSNRSDRRAYMDEFTKRFRDPFTTTNFIEVEMTVPVDAGRDELHDALNHAFGSKPFLYAREGESIKVFSYTEAKAADLNKNLAAVKEGEARAGVLVRLESKLSKAMADAGLPVVAKVSAAVGNERSAQYFLQKFMRAHSCLVDHTGNDVKVALKADRSAALVYESWKPAMQTREIRNAFHLLFSAKAGTNPQAVIASAKSTLDQLAPGHQFVIAHHPETSHVHVHAMVAALSETGHRLSFRKSDLHAWRETFAESMRENGVEMVATRRFDMGASRPYNMRHAGAVERAKKDSRYAISAKTVARVEDKKVAALEPQTLTVNGQAIALAWQQSAALLYGAGAPLVAIEAANRYASAVLSFDNGRPNRSRPDQPERQDAHSSKDRGKEKLDFEQFMRRQDMRPINRLMGDLSMAKTALDVREKMHEINSSLDKMRGTLPPQEQVRFDEFREKLNDQMYDRLAQVRHDKPDQPQGSQQGQERQMRERDVQAKVEPQKDTEKAAEAGQQAQAKAAASAKAKVKAAEQQNRNTQRSQDKDYER